MVKEGFNFYNNHKFYILNSKLHGLTIEYWCNKNPMSLFFYKNGVRDGLYISYHSKGGIVYKGMYKNGIENSNCYEVNCFLYFL